MLACECAEERRLARAEVRADDDRARHGVQRVETRSGGCLARAVEEPSAEGLARLVQDALCGQRQRSRLADERLDALG